MTFDDFKTLIAATFRDPEATARNLIAQDWPISARWMGLLLTVSLSALLSYAASLLYGPPQTDDQLGLLEFTRHPLAMAGLQFAAIATGSALLAGIGRTMGGQGRFADALLLMVWVELLLLIVQAAQVLLSLILPAAGQILAFLVIFLFLWLTAQFTRALHGFDNLLKPILTMLGTVFAFALILSVVLSAFGFAPGVPNDL